MPTMSGEMTRWRVTCTRLRWLDRREVREGRSRMSTWRPFAAHAATAAVTLILALALFGDRPGPRRPAPLAQIPRILRDRVPAAPRAKVPPAPPLVLPADVLKEV